MPSLPLDLERLIFEMAALQDTDHDNRVRLILVAKRVYEWIRPILFRVAIVEDTSRRLTIRKWRNAQIPDVAPFVRHLLVRGNTTIELLSTFYNAENVAIWTISEIDPQILNKLNDLLLRMLSVVLAHGAIDYCPAFRNITHFELISFEGSWNQYKVFTEFPNLTHLCLKPIYSIEDGALLDLLGHCPSLRAMIYDQVVECTFETDDPRFLVFQDRMDLEDLIEEWERSANGRIGLWELADIIIEARKDKFFKNKTSVIFSRTAWMDDLNEDGMRWYKEWRGWKRMARC